MMGLYLSLELLYISLLFISCTLLSVQLCIRAWFPSTQRWGQLLNAFAAVFTVLGGEELDLVRVTGFRPPGPEQPVRCPEFSDTSGNGYQRTVFTSPSDF